MLHDTLHLYLKSREELPCRGIDDFQPASPEVLGFLRSNLSILLDADDQIRKHHDAWPSIFPFARQVIAEDGLDRMYEGTRIN